MMTYVLFLCVDALFVMYMRARYKMVFFCCREKRRGLVICLAAPLRSQVAAVVVAVAAGRGMWLVIMYIMFIYYGSFFAVNLYFYIFLGDIKISYEQVIILLSVCTTISFLRYYVIHSPYFISVNFCLLLTFYLYFIFLVDINGAVY